MKWTIGRKIVVVFALAVLVLIAISGATYLSINQLLAFMEERQHSYNLEVATQGLLSALKDAETGQRGYIITGLDSYLEPYNSGTAGARQAMEELRGLTAGNPERRAAIDRLQPFVNSKLAELKETKELRLAAGFEAAAKKVVSGQGKSDMDEIRNIARGLSSADAASITILAGKVTTGTTWTFATVFGGAIGASIVMLLAGWLLARNIAKPLAEMTLVSERIAAGELGAKMAADHRSDEVGVLRGAFMKMNRVLGEMAAVAHRIADGDLASEVKPQSDRDELGTAFAGMHRNLRQLMSQTRETVAVLSTSAGEINASVTQVAASAAETAAAISETTATVEEVKQTAELNSEKVRLVSESAQQAAQTSEQGRRSVEGTTAGMNRIRQQMDAIGSSMMRLSEQTLAIGEIIASVNDLAEQSNILAVNASIEAAKAGEQGKGFGVVAQEVRSLAEQSKQATTQVRSILNEIQKATSAAMMATEQGSKAVNAGLQQSEQAGQSIAALAESISRSVQAAMQIAASSQQQAVGMDQVAIAIRNIHEASMQNAAAVKQVQQSAQDLSEVGQKLRAQIERYRT